LRFVSIDGEELCIDCRVIVSYLAGFGPPQPLQEHHYFSSSGIPYRKSVMHTIRL